MRTIKFRSRRLDGKGWVEGDLLHCCGKDAGHVFIKTFTGLFKVDPTTVGQYTGMKDKNGQEIYEGDVFHYTNEDGDDCISEVKYDDEDGCFNIADSSYIYGVNYAIKHMNANLLGNIHDNPELLKGGE